MAGSRIPILKGMKKQNLFFPNCQLRLTRKHLKYGLSTFSDMRMISQNKRETQKQSLDISGQEGPPPSLSLFAILNLTSILALPSGVIKI